MPIYEYRCNNCGTSFDARRSMAEADAPIACPNCGSMDARRLISLFAAIGSQGVIAGAGSSCSGCSSSSCAGCSSKR